MHFFPLPNDSAAIQTRKCDFSEYIFSRFRDFLGDLFINIIFYKSIYSKFTSFNVYQNGRKVV